MRGFRPSGARCCCSGWVNFAGSDHLLWGDARARLPDLVERLEGRCDLVLLDAFSPRRCPELWSLEFLSQLARLLAPSGRLLTYSSAAAVRRALELGGTAAGGDRPPAGGARAGPAAGLECGHRRRSDGAARHGAVAAPQPDGAGAHGQHRRGALPGCQRQGERGADPGRPGTGPGQQRRRILQRLAAPLEDRAAADGGQVGRGAPLAKRALAAAAEGAS